MNNQKGFSAIQLLVVIVFILGIAGWFMNIFDLIGMLDGPINAMFIARCVGVFFAPLGSVLGYF